MKLLCINDKVIKIPSGRDEPWTCTAEGLKEGQVYETNGEAFLSITTGKACYYIDGLGQRLCCRFTPLLDELENAQIALDKIKEELNIG